MTLRRAACLLSALVAATSALTPATSTAADERPNIVFLLADDQATISLGCYGNDDVSTPHIDALAARGVVFDNHYVTTAICMASRANILTGMYEYAHGCNFTKGKLSDEDFANTYPQRMRAAGYFTGFAGKWGVDLETKGLPADKFDRWGGGPGQTSYATKKNQSMRQYADEFPHSSRSYGAFGRDFIRDAKKSGKPFCLSISFKAPHMPDTPDPAFDMVYAGKTFKRPANFGREYSAHLSEQGKKGRQWERWDAWKYSTDYDGVMRKYHQLVHGVDAAVGMVVAALEKHGVADNTIIVYTSDNGFLCGSHGYGSKVLPYEESMRVPLIVHDPRHESAGKKHRTMALTGNIDFAPTLLELAGLEPSAGTQGVSLLPLLDDPKGGSVRDELAFMNCWGPAACQFFGVVTPDWKYIYWPYENDEMKPFEELFDMQRDRLELANAATDPDQADALKAMRARYGTAYEELKVRAVQKHKPYAEFFRRK